MNYIDKLSNIATGNQFTMAYLEVAYDDQANEFNPSLTDPDVSYDQFKSHHRDSVLPGIERFVDFLVREQNGLCCYCMGRLDTRHVTIEHVMPRNPSVGHTEDQEYQYYSSQSRIIANGVMPGSLYEQRTKANAGLLAGDQMPHPVAYANLTASCDGKWPLIKDDFDHNRRLPSHCCNNKRGNSRIVPLMLQHDGADKVKYLPQGRMFAAADVMDTIKVLKLNDDTLVEIRHIWYRASVTPNVSLQPCADKPARVDVIRRIFGASDFTRVDSKYHKYAHKDEYWDLLLRYDWFLQYYTHHPIP